MSERNERPPNTPPPSPADIHAPDEAVPVAELEAATYEHDPLLVAGVRRRVDPAAYREKMLGVIEALEESIDDRALLAYLDQETMARLVRAAGQVSLPAKWEKRRIAKEKHRLRKLDRKLEDQAVLDETGIRALRRDPVFRTPEVEDVREAVEPEVPLIAGTVNNIRTCYVCKGHFREIHHFYDQLCPECGEFNFRKRTQRSDLRGRTAIVTCARVKIGYQAAILLLRSGARVIVVTRFPRDAAARYAREADFEDWADRLEIHGIDLRHTPSVLAFTDHLVERGQPLDFLINNACQTVRRPSGFYGHLLAAELEPTTDPRIGRLVEAWDGYRSRKLAAPDTGVDALAGIRAADALDPVGLTHAPLLSQVPLLRDDLVTSEHIFPRDSLDADLQQVDLRSVNSWRLTLAEVPVVELLEVQLVNAVAPFVLNSRLKPLMLKTPSRDKHIVNVSAVEGQFYRSAKTDRHPHTNMAKAALNMMTRTSAPDYAKDGIHMNSVDTGWVTDEDPAALAERKRTEHLFHPPLDIVDGAARIVDPILDGINTGEHMWGYFLKDYRPVPW